jgi:hypothetical protein
VKRLVSLVLVSSVAWGPCERAAAHESGRVDRWRATALATGWTAQDWPRLRCIIARESGGNPGAYNPERQAGAPYGWGSRGLMQVFAWPHRTWIVRAAGGNLSRLYDPTVNLRVARRLYLQSRGAGFSGWRPWASTNRPC